MPQAIIDLQAAIVALAEAFAMNDHTGHEDFFSISRICACVSRGWTSICSCAAKIRD
jgi:hypothetical protein